MRCEMPPKKSCALAGLGRLFSILARSFAGTQTQIAPPAGIAVYVRKTGRCQQAAQGIFSVDLHALDQRSPAAFRIRRFIADEEQAAHSLDRKSVV